MQSILGLMETSEELKTAVLGNRALINRVTEIAESLIARCPIYKSCLEMLLNDPVYDLSTLIKPPDGSLSVFLFINNREIWELFIEKVQLPDTVFNIYIL